ncbi:MAG: PQQ-binding-like beta-propeller repeat protein, partial [Lentisphaeria bacterium]|nr:PQQ-binding-like beta-propeller repeat protein [Lentisphaeria bacterium]
MWRSVDPVLRVCAVVVSMCAAMPLRATWSEELSRPCTVRVRNQEVEVKSLPVKTPCASGTVVDWGVRTTPVILPSSYPTPTMLAKLRRYRKGVGIDSLFTKPGLKGSPAEASEWMATLRPTVRVTMSVLLRAKVRSFRSMRQYIWPGAACVRFLRASSETGEFTEFTALDAAALEQAVARVNESGGTTKLYEFSLSALDSQLAPGTVGYYRVRVEGADGALLAESGACEGVALDMPRVEGKFSGPYDASLHWDTKAPGWERLETPPIFLLGVSSFPLFRHLPDEPPPRPLYIPSRPIPVPRVRFMSAFPATVNQATENLDCSVWRESSRTPTFVLFGFRSTIRLREWSRHLGSSVATRICGFAGTVRDKGGEALVLPRDGPVSSRTEKSATAVTRATRWPLCFSWHTTTTSKTWENEGWRLFGPHGMLTGQAKQYSTTLHDLLSPGPSERCRVICFLRDPEGGEHQLEATSTRSPYPLDFRARDRCDGVALRWTPPVVDPVDWIVPPRIVIRKQASCCAFPSGFPEQISIAETVLGRVVYRGPLAVGQFVDHEADTDQVYLYTAEIEGLAEEIHRWDQASPVPMIAVVRSTIVRNDSPRERLWVVGRRAPADTPVAVAIVAPKGQEGQVMQTALMKTFAQRPDTYVVERDRIGAAFLEEELGRLGPNQRRPDSRAASDIALTCRVRCTAAGRYGEVIFEDFLNQRTERLHSVRLIDYDEDTFVQAVERELASRFPRLSSAPRTIDAATPPPQPQHHRPRVALAEISLTSGTRGMEKTASGFYDSLFIAMAQQDTYEMVERSSIDAVLGELEKAALAGSDHRLKLGQLLQADYLVTGALARSGNDLSAHLFVTSVHSGIVHSPVLEKIAADAIDVGAQKIADAIGTEVLSLQAEWRTVPDIVALLEMEQTCRATDSETRARQKAYLGLAPGKDVVRLAQETLTKGHLEEAKGYYLRILQKTPVKGHFTVHYCLIIDDIHRRQGLNDQQRRVWLKRSAKYMFASERKTGRDCIDLAERFLAIGDAVEAENILRRSGIGGQAAATCWERLGNQRKAMEICLDDLATKQTDYWNNAAAMIGHVQQTRMCIPTAVRLLQNASEADAIRLLEALAGATKPKAPFQYLMAIEELAKRGAFPRVGKLAALKARGILYDAPGIEAFCDPTFNVSVSTLKGLPLHPLTREDRQRYMKIMRRGPNEDPGAWLQRRRKLMQTLRGVKNPVVLCALKDDAVSAFVSTQFLREYASQGHGLKLPGKDLFCLLPNGLAMRACVQTGEIRWIRRVACLATPQFPRLAHRFTEFNPNPKPIIGRGPPLPESAIINLVPIMDALCWTDGKLVLVPDLFNGVLYALDANTGARVWEFRTWVSMAPPLVRGDLGRVYVGDAGGTLNVLRSRDGAVLATVHSPAAKVQRVSPHVDLRYGKTQKTLVLRRHISSQAFDAHATYAKKCADFTYDMREPTIGRRTNQARSRFSGRLVATWTLDADGRPERQERRGLSHKSSPWASEAEFPLKNVGDEGLIMWLTADRGPGMRKRRLAAMIHYARDTTASDQVRCIAIETARRVDSTQLRHVLFDCLSSDRPMVRRTAAACLAWDYKFWKDPSVMGLERIVNFVKETDAVDHAPVLPPLINHYGVFLPQVLGAQIKPGAYPRPWILAESLARLGEPALAPLVSKLRLQGVSEQDADTILTYLLRGPGESPPYPQRGPLTDLRKALLQSRDPRLLSAYLRREKESKLRTKNWYEKLQEPIPASTGKLAPLSPADRQEITDFFYTLRKLIEETGGDEEIAALFAKALRRFGGGYLTSIKHLGEVLALYDGDVLSLMAEVPLVEFQLAI